ncbi:Coq4 family protein [Anabaena sp. CCY 0017]|uniref:Coq4 family protein n=1 Tax=Anabaena sp. CCY 0017 TaxID=3103866 RepID=UPI0039C6A261
MFKKLAQIKMLLNYKNSEPLGDFAILKSELLGAKVSPQVAAKLKAVEGYHPPINLDKLSQYPPGSFGREYADHMQANHLQPFNVSPELEDVAKSNVFALRYAVTHDIFHVLLGFDTSYAGEIGVLAFAVEQNYSKLLKIGLWIAKLLYPILAPQQIQAIFTNMNKGRYLGENAEFLLGYQFEEHWTESIAEIRKCLSIPPIESLQNCTITAICS